MRRQGQMFAMIHSMATDEEIVLAMRELRDDYLRDLPTILSQLEAALDQALDTRTTEHIEAAYRLAHQIAGTSGCHGLGALSASSARLESDLLEARALRDALGPAGDDEVLSELAARISRARRTFDSASEARRTGH